MSRSTRPRPINQPQPNDLRKAFQRLEHTVDRTAAESANRKDEILKTLQAFRDEVMGELVPLKDFVKRVADNHEVRITELEHARP